MRKAGLDLFVSWVRPIQAVQPGNARILVDVVTFAAKTGQNPKVWQDLAFSRSSHETCAPAKQKMQNALFFFCNIPGKRKKYKARPEQREGIARGARGREGNHEGSARARGESRGNREGARGIARAQGESRGRKTNSKTNKNRPNLFNKTANRRKMDKFV